MIVRDTLERVLLLKRSTTASHHPGMWENPGGKCDDGESFEACARREMLEEISVVAGELEQLFEKKFLDDERQEYFHVIMYQTVTESEPEIAEPETFSEIGWFTLDELQTLPDIADYCIQDFKRLGWL